MSNQVLYFLAELTHFRFYLLNSIVKSIKLLNGIFV